MDGYGTLDYSVYIDWGEGRKFIVYTKSQSVARFIYEVIKNKGICDVFLFYGDNLYFEYIAELER